MVFFNINLKKIQTNLYENKLKKILLLIFFLIYFYINLNYVGLQEFMRNWYDWDEIPLWPVNTIISGNPEILKKIVESYDFYWNTMFVKHYIELQGGVLDLDARLELLALYKIGLHIWCMHSSLYFTNPEFIVNNEFNTEIVAKVNSLLVLEMTEVSKSFSRIQQFKFNNNVIDWDKYWSDLEKRYINMFKEHIKKN